jgi:hypothetical protein
MLTVTISVTTFFFRQLLKHFNIMQRKKTVFNSRGVKYRGSYWHQNIYKRLNLLLKKPVFIVVTVVVTEVKSCYENAIRKI